MYPIFIGLGILIMIITYLTIVQPAQWECFNVWNKKIFITLRKFSVCFMFNYKCKCV
jgi:hypothetical protein